MANTDYTTPGSEKQAIKAEHLSADMNIVLQGDDGVEYTCRLGALREWLGKEAKK